MMSSSINTWGLYCWEWLTLRKEPNIKQKESGVRRRQGQTERKKQRQRRASLSDDENISLSGAKKSPQRHLFYPPLNKHKTLDPTTLAKKRKPLGKTGRLLGNQHVYNQVSSLFSPFLFKCITLGHPPSVL